MAHPHPTAAPAPGEVRAASADPLDAILALCLRADPSPGSAEAAELARLLETAARAGGPQARARIARALHDRPWRRPAAEAVGPPPTEAAAAWAAGGAPADDERRLAAKLAAGGRLHPAHLLSALRDGRVALFHAALDALCGLDAGEAQATVARSAEGLAWALRAAGVDRSVFPSVRARLRAEGIGPPPPEGEDGDTAVLAALRSTPAQARAHLHGGAGA